MLIAESRRRSNPRVLYGILAESALEQFDDNSTDSENRRAYFQNLIRLLEMYRYNTLRRTAPRAVLDRRQTDLKALKRDRADNESVEQALSSAHRTVYANLEKDELLQHFKDLFGRISRQAPVSAEELAKARQFLEVLAQALRA